MAKIAYSKLGLKKQEKIEPVILSFNEQNIEICQYLPIEKKLDLISKIINQSIDENGYYNICRINLFLNMEIIFAYTNISITEKQREDIFKVYDDLYSSGLMDQILDKIPDQEYDYIRMSVMTTIEKIYEYKNSALGILDTISKDYSNLEFDAQKIQTELANPENLTLLKNILTKLG